MNHDPGETIRATILKETKPVESAQSGWTDWKIGQILLDEYKITGILGKGMGIVYRVEPFKFSGPPMALKTLFANTLLSADYKRGLMNELRVWIELPEHPCFTAFRFFRTIRDRMGLFLEYVDGGSLEDWISQKRLVSVDSILAVAIKFAWALESLHSYEIVHQDIKPKNVLMTADGQVKLTDFGLAQARGLIGPSLPGTVDFGNFEVSYRGGTKAYCSPRQFAGQKLTLHTDIWSFGVSVLQMFTGEVFWDNGALIPLFLQTKYTPGGYGPIPRMPDSVYCVLKRCFEPGPEDRWNSMLEVAEALQEAYKHEIDAPYSPLNIQLRKPVNELGSDSAGSITVASSWIDPMDFVRRCENLRLTSRSGEDLIPQRQGSPKTQALIDLQIYEELVHHMFYAAPDAARCDEDLAGLFTNKGLVHQEVHDFPGAFTCYDSAITILDKLVEQQNKNEARMTLANVLMKKSSCLSQTGRAREALETVERAEVIYQQTTSDAIGGESGIHQAKAYMLKANILKTLGRFQESVSMLDRSLTILLPLVTREDSVMLRSSLASVYLNKATCMRELANFRTAIEFFDLAITMFERLITADNRKDLEPGLATALMNKAVSLGSIGLAEDSRREMGRSIAIQERLVYQEGRYDLESGLAIALMNMGTMLDDNGCFAEALTYYNRAVSMYERMICFEGRREQEPNLAMTLCNKASVLDSLTRSSEALEVSAQSVEIYERLVTQQGRREMEAPLSMVYMNRAIKFFMLDRMLESLEFFDKSIALRARLVREDGRGELLGDLCWAQMGRVQVIEKMGNLELARKEAKEAMENLRAEYQRTEQVTLKAVIDYIDRNLSRLL